MNRLYKGLTGSTEPRRPRFALPSPLMVRRSSWVAGARVLVAAVGCWLLASRVLAFPPAPHHTLFGMVRDDMGEPIKVFPCEVVLETSSGIKLRCNLVSNLEPGANYRLEVPIDSGMTEDLYKPTAMRPYFQFKLTLRINQKTYLPIEMSGDFSKIGEPSERTRIDLTLGEDADGDGLPDAWEAAQLARQGGGHSELDPAEDSDGDGVSNLDEYLAGTYAFDPSDGFSLALVEIRPDHSVLELLTVPGRTYHVLASPDLQTWTRTAFRIPSEAATGLREFYPATDVRVVRVEVPVSPDVPNRYFKAMVQ